MPTLAFLAVSGPYDRPYLETIGGWSRLSAQAVVPGIVELLAPRSVIDLGCGRGSWLAVFLETGIEDVLGVDGAWVERSVLEIPEDRFVEADLAEGFSSGRTFDLALSLEVAEHLPESAAERLVDSLVALAPAVLFSAAVPGQGGVNHMNEKWQGFWAERFLQRGYTAVDAVRPKHWDDDSVNWWYLQNTLLYVDDSLIELPAICAVRERVAGFPLSVVHPRLFEYALRRERSSRVRRAGRALRRLKRRP